MQYPYPMPKSQELLLVRHGQSTANARGIWQGQMEFPLSEEGRNQAGIAGLALSREPLDGLYSSPLSRAFETASIVRERTGFSGEVVPVEGLSERSGGLLEGYTWAEQERRNPELARKVSRHPRGGTLGARRGGDRRGSYREVRGGHRVYQHPPPRGLADRSRLARRRDACLPEGTLRTRGVTGRAEGGQRFDHAHGMGRCRSPPSGGGHNIAPCRRPRSYHRGMNQLVRALQPVSISARRLDTPPASFLPPENRYLKHSRASPKVKKLKC